MQHNERTEAPCQGTSAACPAATKKLSLSSVSQTGSDGLVPNRETGRRQARADGPEAGGAGPALTTLTPIRPRAAVLVSIYDRNGRVQRRVRLSMTTAERDRDRAIQASRVVSLDLVMITPASGAAERGEALAEVAAVSA